MQKTKKKNLIKIELYNDDCLEKLRDIPDGSIDLVLADPPYEISACDWDKMIPIEPMWVEINRVIKDKGNIVIFSKQPFTTKLNYGNLENFRYELIWQKQQGTSPMLAKKRILPIHENISVFYKQLGTYNPQMTYGHKNYGGFANPNNSLGAIYGETNSRHRNCDDGSRYPTSIVKCKSVRHGIHPTQKPLGLLEYLILTYSNEGDLVLDFCMGSGSTGVACKHTNRNFIGIEKDKTIFESAKGRIETN